MTSPKRTEAILTPKLAKGSPSVPDARLGRGAPLHQRDGASGRHEAGGRLVLTEKDEERRGDAFMAAHGYTVVRFSQARATQQTEGIPDRRYYHAGWRHALWWEAKRVGGRQRPAQRTFQAMAEACGEEYVLGSFDALAAHMTRRLPRFRGALTLTEVTP